MNTYSVVQFLPDPLADERINIGVVVFAEDGLRSRFLRRWHRVRNFAPGADLDFLQEFAREVSAASADQLPLDKKVVEASTLSGTAEHWQNSIQLTPPRASSKDADALLDLVARRFLREGTTRRARGRDRRAAIAIAHEHMQHALQERSRDALELLTRQLVIQGALEAHEFDVGLRNGKPLLGVLGLSFEKQNTADALRDLHAAAWAIDDVRTRSPKLSLAVVLLPPKSRSKTYDRAVHVIEGLEAAAVPEPDVGDWASDAVKAVVPRSLLTAN